MSKPRSQSRPVPPASSRSGRASSSIPSAPPTVSGRWLLSGLVIALLAAIFCAWGTLCILFWQGSWQLLYHPTSAIAQTPATYKVPYQSIGFDTSASGEPQLRGWWIPSESQPRFTAVYLHGQTGNVGDTLQSLISVHNAGLNIFAFDYRGYGQSHFLHPSEKNWREDAESAMRYLTGTRHIPPSSIILIGRDLGANLAVEVAAAHPDLAGVVLEQPLPSPTSAIFDDARARLVPARLLVSDRWDTTSAGSNLLIPSLWLYWDPKADPARQGEPAQAYKAVPARKTIVWLSKSPEESRQFETALSAFLDELPKPGK